MPERIDNSVRKAAETAVIEGNVSRLGELLRQNPALPKEWDISGGTSTDEMAQRIIAKEHFFRAFHEFSRFSETVKDRDHPLAQFEAAVDAIVEGHIPNLEKLLAARPELIRARSSRTHRSTLLHYLGANGVESWRQKTPPNAVNVLEVLLEAGAEVDAEADMYGGGSTPLGLVATSIHPWRAGLVELMIDTLLQNGARMRGPELVNGCLANGRPWAAIHLALQGAPLDLEGAAGVGRLDLIEKFFDENGNLRNATSAQMHHGFAWACEYGVTDAAEFLLEKGMSIDAPIRNHGQTGLHWAAYGAHLETVKMLLNRGAPVNARDQTFNGTPLGWALYGWAEGVPQRPAHLYPEVVSLLVKAGAIADVDWLVERGLDEKISADPTISRALEQNGDRTSSCESNADQ
jgi:hypothetical protein